MEKNAFAFWEWVQSKMEEEGIASFRELDRKAGMAHGVIGARKNDLKFPTVEMAEGLCRALKVSWVELWSEAGFIERLPTDQLVGLDAEIHQVLQSTDHKFKRTVLVTVKAWLALYGKNS